MRTLLAAVAAVVLAGCYSFSHTVSEKIVHPGPYYRLRMVHQREGTNAMFLIYDAYDHHRLQCSSPATKKRWVEVGEHPYPKQMRFEVIDDRTFVFIGHGIRATFDGCASFAGWWVRPEHVADENELRRPTGFPQYEDVRVTPDGKISFRVTSPAFHGGALRVSSNDRGQTWTVEGAPQ